MPKDKEQAVEERKWLDPQEKYDLLLQQINEVKTRENQKKYN